MPELFLREVVTDEALRVAIATAYARPATVAILDEIGDVLELEEVDVFCVRNRLTGDWRLHLDIFPLDADELRCLEIVRRIAAGLGTAALSNHAVGDGPEHYGSIWLLDADGERLVVFDDDYWDETGSVRIKPRS
jgi:hypothetical protein